MYCMDAIPNNDIKTTRRILLAEVVLVIVFIGLASVSLWVGNMLVGAVVLFFTVNIAWAVHLIIDRPPGYGLHVLLTLLMCIGILVGVILYLINGTIC